MSHRVLLRPEAEEEIHAGAEWYRKHGVGLDTAFLDEVARVVEAIRSQPEQHPIVEADVRKAVLRRFPYIVLYRQSQGGDRPDLVLPHEPRSPAVARAVIGRLPKPAAELQQRIEQVEEVLALNEEIRELAEAYADARNFLYLGRGYQFPVALEGALELEEVSYIHAEGYPAAEMKHGPIALIDEDMPVVFLAPKDPVYGKVVSNIEEVKARGGRIIAVVSDGAAELEGCVDHLIRVPQTVPSLLPVLTTVPLQLLAYHIAVLGGGTWTSPATWPRASRSSRARPEPPRPSTRGPDRTTLRHVRARHGQPSQAWRCPHRAI